MNVKTFVRSCFHKLGFEIHRVDAHARAQGQIVKDPFSHNSAEKMNAFYADQKTVAEYLDPRRLEFYEGVLRVAQEEGVRFDGKSIVDVGCGTGHLLIEVGKISKPASLLGLEYAEEAIGRAREFCPEASFEHFDIYAGHPAKFDVVFCMEVIEHLEHPARAVQNLVGMIAAGGSAVLTVPDGRKDQFLGHINFWSPESWKVFVEEQAQGCRVVCRNAKNGNNIAIVTRT